MTAWNQAATQRASTAGIAADVQQLAASYQVGMPLQMYRDNSMAGFCLFLGLGLMFTGIGIIGTLWDLLFPGLAGSSSASILAAPLFASALGLVLVSLAALSLRSWCRGSKTYECTEGWLKVDKYGAVIVAVRWDQMQVLWDRIRVGTIYNQSTHGYKTYLVHTYSVGIASGAQYSIVSERLWKRIEEEFVRLHFPQALAMFNAGQRVPFNSVSVSQQGVSKELLYLPGITGMPLQHLAHVRIRSTDLCFEGGGAYLHTDVLVPFSETANVCLLEALLKTVTGGVSCALNRGMLMVVNGWACLSRVADKMQEGEQCSCMRMSTILSRLPRQEPTQWMSLRSMEMKTPLCLICRCPARVLSRLPGRRARPL